MMSGNSFSVKKALRRRVWSAAVSGLFFFLYYVLGTSLAVTRTRSFAEAYQYTVEVAKASVSNAVRESIGLSAGYGWIGVVGIAVMLGVQGFAYLDSRRQIDFYESQPEKRSHRFRRIYLEGILIYVLTAVTGLAAGLITVALLRAATLALVLEIVLESLRLFILFLGVYSITVLSVMWTGNVIVSLLADAVLLLYEIVLSEIIYALKNTFFYTFSSAFSGASAAFSPIYDYCVVLSGKNPAAAVTSYYSEMTLSVLRQSAAFLVLYDVFTLITAAAATGIAYLSYKKRRTESAGTAVVFAPIRVLARIAVSSVIALGAGLVVLRSFASGREHSATVIIVIVMIVTACIVCSVMQIIYDFDFRSFLRGAWAMTVSSLIAVLVLAAFETDCFGYDRYVPDLSQVESCALIPDNGTTVLGTDGNESMDYSAYALRNMKLTDTQSVAALASYGQEYTVKTRGSAQSSGDYFDNSQSEYHFTVLYRMKSGQKVYRSFYIPQNCDRTLPDKIFSSVEYKEASLFSSVNAAFLQNYENIRGAEIDYCYPTGDKDMNAADMKGLAKALAADAAQYSFSNLVDNYPVGELDFQIRSGGYITALYIYPWQENTIRWLESEGIYGEAMPDAADVAKISVTNTHSEYWNEDNTESSDYDPSVTVEYTDPVQIKKILDHSYGSNFTSPWNNNGEDYYNYNLNGTMKDGTEFYLCFKEGEVPSFVETDTAN